MTLQLSLAQRNFLTLVLPIAVLSAECYTAMHFLACPQRTLSVLGPPQWTTKLPHFPSPITSSMARKEKCSQNLAAWVRLGVTRGAPRHPGDNSAMTRSPSGKELPSSANVKGEVIHVVTGPSNGASETTETAVWVTKFGVTSHRHKYLLLNFTKIWILRMAIQAMRTFFPS